MYRSLYTGPEVDKAIGTALGETYREGIVPGCHEKGSFSENPQNLYEVIIPGKYTIIFYYDMDSANNPIPMPFEGESPIFMQVTYNDDHHWQRIQIGAMLYYRDLASGDYQWKMVDLGIQAIEVIDNLTSTRIDAALSANMGRQLKYYIDDLQIGNINLANNTGLRRSAEGWNMPTNTSRDDVTTYEDRPTFLINGSGLSSTTEFLAITSLASYDHPVSLENSYTGSVWVKPTTSADANVFVQVCFVDETHTTITGGKKYEVVAKANKWTRISVTTKDTVASSKFVKIYFGVTNKSSARFASPKLEFGYYATGWMPSYYDMWTEYDNANFINENFVDADEVKDHQGIIFDGTQNCYKNEYLAVGGGGGFVQSQTPPDNKEVLWYKLPPYKTPGGTTFETENTFHKLFRYRRSNETHSDSTEGWVRAIEPFFIYKGTAPSDSEYEHGWLNTSEEDNLHPAVLNYYDKTHLKWRPVGAAPSKNWVIQPNPPEDTELLWIQTPIFVMKVYYDGAWVPIHAIWGNNIQS